MKKSSSAFPDNPGSNIERLSTLCQEKFFQIVSDVKNAQGQEAHQVEILLFKSLMQLGLLLLELFFTSHKAGDYGETLKTAKGIAKRGRLSAKSYFSIFGKLKVRRYLYHIGATSFAPLDVVLNLPVRCYSYFLSEWVNHLNVNDVYEGTVTVLKRFFGLPLSVAAVETITQDSVTEYEAYYELKKAVSLSAQAVEVLGQERLIPESPATALEKSLFPSAQDTQLTVVGFDGKGVAMIKKEAAKIKGRQGKGEKRQKKKEALVGVKYTIAPEVRMAEEVAQHVVYPEQTERESDSKKTARARYIRYLASIKKPKRAVMREILQDIEEQSFEEHPLICLIDGARALIRAVNDVFQSVTNKVIILDIIHVLEYIWLIAYLKYTEGSDEARHYVYDKLVLILQGGVKQYIKELQGDLETETWTASHRKTFTKVLTYLNNHTSYMKYNEYLACGYPIATGVVESACGHVVKDRMEKSGARWSIDGAEAMLRLRSVVKSQDWDAYWTFYTAQFRDKTFLEIEDRFLNSKEEKLA